MALGGEISSADEQEARLNARMLTRTTSPVILADGAKFGRQLTFHVARIGAGMRVVVDGGVSADWEGRLAEFGCDLVLA